MLNLETADAPHKLRRVAIEPLTRVEGHGKVTILLDDDNRVHQVRLHIVEFRGFEAFIERPALLGSSGHGAAPVRHLPGQPPPRRGQGDGPRRRLRAADADRGEAPPAAALRPDRAVARAALLPPRLARSAARLRERGRQAQHRRRRGGVPRSGQTRRADAQVRAGSDPSYRRQAHSRHRRRSPAA